MNVHVLTQSFPDFPMAMWWRFILKSMILSDQEKRGASKWRSVFHVILDIVVILVVGRRCIVNCGGGSYSFDPFLFVCVCVCVCVYVAPCWLQTGWEGGQRRKGAQVT